MRGVLVESLGVSRCATTSSSSSSTMRVVVGDVNRSWKRDDVRTGAVLLRELGAGPLVRIGGTTGATNGSEVSKTCQTTTVREDCSCPLSHQVLTCRPTASIKWGAGTGQAGLATLIHAVWGAGLGQETTCTAWNGELGTMDTGGCTGVLSVPPIAVGTVEAVAPGLAVAPPLDVRSTPALHKRGAAASVASNS